MWYFGLAPTVFERVNSFSASISSVWVGSEPNKFEFVVPVTQLQLQKNEAQPDEQLLHGQPEQWKQIKVAFKVL